MRNEKICRRRRKEHSQYYTSENIAKKLIDSIPYGKVNSVLDLSAGLGALLEASEKRYKNANLYAVDIDPENITRLLKKDKIVALCLDSSHLDCIKKIRGICSEFDLVVGNPPYKSIKHNKYTQEKFEKWGLSSKSKHCRLEILFLILSVELTSKNGSCSIVLPDIVFTSTKYSIIRKNLAKKFKYINVIELKERSFHGTEAKAYILTVSNADGVNETILSGSMSVSDYLTLSVEDFVERADYKYNVGKRKYKGKTLHDEGIEIIRGKETKLKRKPSNDEMIHSTSFIEKFSIFENDIIPTAEELCTKAVKGDVVIPRVGSRSLGKVGIINQGCFNITDCVFLLKTSQHNCGEKIAEILNSKYGYEWIQCISKGVGAKFITLRELQKLPINPQVQL